MGNFNDFHQLPTPTFKNRQTLDSSPQSCYQRGVLASTFALLLTQLSIGTYLVALRMAKAVGRDAMHITLLLVEAIEIGMYFTPQHQLYMQRTHDARGYLFLRKTHVGYWVPTRDCFPESRPIF